MYLYWNLVQMMGLRGIPLEETRKKLGGNIMLVHHKNPK